MALYVLHKDIKLTTILILILIVKVIWIISVFSHFIVKKYYPQYESINNNIENVSFDIFTLLIGILLIYLFDYFYKEKVCIEGHTKLYLFSFGILASCGVIQKQINKYYFHKIYV
jgi:flagellar biosynthesis protein FlhB